MTTNDVIIEPVLWTYKPLENGNFSIYLRLTYYKDVKYISTGFSTSTIHWDSDNYCPRPSHPKFRDILKKIDKLTEDIYFEIRLAEKEERDDLTLSEIKETLKVKKRPTQQADVREKLRLFELYDQLILDYESKGNIGYSDVFKASKSSVQKVIKKDKAFEAVTEAEFFQYELSVSKHKTESTKSFYLRTFYRVWNIAIKRGFCKKTYHPKAIIELKAYKRIRTKKRAISSDYFLAIEELPYEYGSRLFRSQHFFLFLYFARGISWKDFALMRYDENLRGDQFSYTRSKNKREYDYKLHPKAMAVINIFKNYPLQSDGGYVFPVLMKEHNTPRAIDQRVESSLKDLNEDLKVMAKAIGLNKNLTSYIARHSFATTLNNKNVDVKIIQEAMGHETELQTRTYLAEIDDSLVAASIEAAL